MIRPLALRVTILLLSLQALLPLGIAGLVAVVLSGDVIGGQHGVRFVGYATVLSAWPFLTAMGIAGYRHWALVSILALAAVQSAVAAFCLSSDLAAFSKVPIQRNSPLEPVYLALLAIGVWWLVYFSRPSTRALFAPKP